MSPAPARLSEADKTFLIENVHRLSKGGEVSYDPVTGQLSVTYPSAGALRSDIGPHIGGERPNIVWSDDHYFQSESHLLPLPGHQTPPFSFGGAGTGFFFLPFPFQDTVTIEFDLEVGLKRSNGSLWVALRSLKDGATFNYDPGAKPDAGSNDQRVVKTLQVPIGGAQVGLNWQGIKFVARGLSIRGRLEPQEALRILQDELHNELRKPLELPQDPQCPPFRGWPNRPGGVDGFEGPGAAPLESVGPLAA